MIKNIVFIMVVLSFTPFGCNSQDKEEKKDDRQPYAAGKFFSDNPEELRKQLSLLFKKADSKPLDNLRAIIVPHAGYVYSGEVAAAGYGLISPDKQYENIFIIASSHRVAFKGASIYHTGDYITPFGKVKVNTELAGKLVRSNPIFTFRPDAHLYEHSLEVQLPFLQYHMKENIQIVPIVLGTQSKTDCRDIAEALKPYFNEKNLFVISTDFSHYPPYEEAIRVDNKTADAILSKSVQTLENVLDENKHARIKDLSTSLCGWSSVFTCLYLTEGREDYTYIKIKYMNSGDQEFGDKTGVVGYYSIAVVKDNDKMGNDSEFVLSKKDKNDLLMIARQTLNQYIIENTIPAFDTEGFSKTLQQGCGAFVTLNKDHKLRGCIGRFSSSDPLYKVIIDMSVASSTQDTRFPRVTPDELDEIEIEISVLTPLQLIKSIDEIELGRHGIYIKKGYATGTFLPQVATQTNWSLEEFLGHCSRDKAGIGWNGWKDADIYIYEAIVFGENGPE